MKSAETGLWQSGVRQECGGGGGGDQAKELPASMSLGHALDWEELAAGERPG